MKKSYQLNGVFPSPQDDRDFPVRSIVKPIVTLPTEVMLEHKLIKILDQGFCGVCVGKATNSIMSAYYKEALSSLYIYSLCKLYDGIPNSEGTYPRTAMKVLQGYGACKEETMPYSLLKQCTVLPKITDQALAEGKKRTMTTYARARNLAEIREALAAGHFILGVIGVGDNFMEYRGGVLSHLEGRNYGYHAVVFCGFNDIMEAVRGVNSWGEGWGEKGLFWMSYENFFTQNNVIEAWIMEVKEKPSPSCKEKVEKFVQRWKSRKG